MQSSCITVKFCSSLNHFMKKIITSLMTLPFILLVHGQPDPALTGVYCPGVTTTFHYTMPGGAGSYSNVSASGNANTGIAGSQAVQNISSVTLTSGGSQTIFTFTGRFADWATPQGIQIAYR